MLAVVMLRHASQESCPGHSCRGWAGCCASRESCFWQSAPLGNCIAVQVAWRALSYQDRLPVVAVTEDDHSLAAMLERQLLP